MKNSTENQVKGKMRELKGRGKAAIGEATEDRRMESEGHADKMSGKLQKKTGDVQQVFED